MKLVILNGNGGVRHRVNINEFLLFLLSVLMIGSLLLSALALHTLFVQDKQVSRSEKKVIYQFDQLLLKTAKLEAQVKRLHSISKSLADKSNIDIQKYLLSQDPAMGGLQNNSSANTSDVSSIFTKAKIQRSIADLEIDLELQEQRFKVMELTQQSKASKTGKGKTKYPLAPSSYFSPVKSGYISSSFGHRRDPINGHRRHHNGIDIAAKHGSKIHAIASGFVTFVGHKGGYGNVIEINHDKTLKSLYAHLYKMNVKKGQVVRKGQVIASMGQTGRATGSHLHLEVSKNSKALNPAKFIDTALIK